MDNTRGSLFMVLAMAAFAIEDMLIKAASASVPVGVILMLFGCGGTIIFALLTWKRGESIVNKSLTSTPILVRFLCEIGGRLCYTLALALTPLSTASAILQATPLVAVMGAAILFNEKVGLKRWIAILIGFIGVLMIIRPGMDGFVPASIFAVLGMLGFAGRDLSTRAAHSDLSNMQLGVYGFFALIPSGLAIQLYTGDVITPISNNAALMITAATLVGVLAYNALTIAMRTGDVSVVAPFRYSRLLFALILGALVFAEQPDMMTLSGGLVIVLSGGYILLQSRKKPQIRSLQEQV